MKRSLLATLLLCAVIAVPRTGYGQETLDTPVNLNLNGITVENALERISEQSGVLLVYNNEMPLLHESVSLETTGAPVRQALAELLGPRGLTYEAMGDYVLVKEKSAPVVPAVEPVESALAAIQVTGRVTDAETGESLPGVSVVVQGSSQGTTTDADGAYAITVPRPEDVLVFSYIGYTTQEVPVEGRTVVDVALQSEVSALDEVVVVGYGTERRVNLTGAVDQVTSEVLDDRPITNLAQGLQGAVPNLNIVFSDGQPGSGAEFNIRGITSINGGSPLVLIDGVAGDPTLLNPRDIESVSVLKDAASAAVYGARGAFGVILITTKAGDRRRPQVNYSSNIAISNPTIVPEAVTDPFTSMYLYNEAYKGYAGNDQFTQEDLDYARQRSLDPSLPAVVIDEVGGEEVYKYFGNTDWFDEMYDENQSLMQHNLSVSGQQDGFNYFVSGGYLHQKGVFEYNPDVFRRYNFRAKTSFDVTPWLTLNNNLMYNKGIYDAPTFWGTSVDIWRYIAVVDNAQHVPQNPDGTWTYEGFPIAFLRDGGRSLKKDNVFQNTVGFELSFFKNSWRVTGDYTYQSDGYNNDEHFKQIMYSQRPGVLTPRGVNRIVDTDTDNYYHIYNLYSEYEKQLGEHYMKGMVGFNQELRTFEGTTARREDPVSDLGSIGLAVGDTYADGWASEWALRGLFYRVNYQFRDRYLFELNGRFDGTSRFPKEDRFGFFPSASAGWRISEEPFFQPLKPAFSDLKLRASYGSLGNQLVDTYAYIATMPASQSGVIIGGQKPTVVGPPALVSPTLTWEKATTLDIGVDASFLSDRLALVFDWYRRNTTDMLTKGRTLPAVLGANEPDENAADLRTTGWEVSLNWDDEQQLFGRPFGYNLGFVLSDSRSEITRFDNPNGYLGDYYVGQQWGEIWGYETEGFFQSEDEIANHADQSFVMRFPDNIGVGDLKFADLNGDGKVDQGDYTLENHGDLRVIGNTEPRYSYGINGGFDWSNFSLSFFLQGIGKRDYYPGGETSYFWSIYNRPYNTTLEHIVDNYWTPENPDAYFPRLKAYIALQDGKELSAQQTRYLQDASYLRLKNVTLGYTLPQSMTARVGVERLRLYVSGENLWERTNLRIPVDPELLLRSHSWGDGSKYPFQRSYSVGVDLTF